MSGGQSHGVHWQPWQARHISPAQMVHSYVSVEGSGSLARSSLSCRPKASIRCRHR